MSNIVIISGDLREGQRVEIGVDYSGSSISSLYTNKKWLAFSERNVKWSGISSEYYYDTDSDGVIFNNNNSDSILITNLKIGRLFCKFEYTDLQGNDFEVVKVYNILPKKKLTINEQIEGYTTSFLVQQEMKNVAFDFITGHDNNIITNSDGKLDTIVENDGYYDYEVIIDWSLCTYSDNTEVIWASTPADKLIVGGYLGGGEVATGSITESISGKYLVKEDISKNIKIDVSFSKSVDNTADAPLRGFFSDETVYGYDFDNGPHKLEYIDIDYGDGTKDTNYTLNVFKEKMYKRSGEYKLTFSIHTIHELNDITYRQVLQKELDVAVKPFFGTFVKTLFPGGIYKSDGFNDLMDAWGAQMDRLYNETQTLVESLDVETMNDKFFKGYASTYGDFEHIYRKIGFISLTDGKEDRFDYFSNYDIFDRIESGDISNKEKVEFIEYIKTSKERLLSKGTPYSIERAIAEFALKSKVVELWTNYEGNRLENKVLTDEIFDGNRTTNRTGVTFKNISMPYADNEDNLILDSKDNSFIEINTIDNVENTYVTDISSTKTIDGVKYIKIN